MVAARLSSARQPLLGRVLPRPDEAAPGRPEGRAAAVRRGGEGSGAPPDGTVLPGRGAAARRRRPRRRASCLRRCRTDRRRPKRHRSPGSISPPDRRRVRRSSKKSRGRSTATPGSATIRTSSSRPTTSTLPTGGTLHNCYTTVNGQCVGLDTKGEMDGFFAIALGGKYRLFAVDLGEGSLGYDFYQSVHFQTSSFDLQNHELHLDLASTAARAGSVRRQRVLRLLHARTISRSTTKAAPCHG